MQFDPITLEILWNRLISIADESAAALLRTSFSTIVRESNDFATVLMDGSGNSLAENTGGIASFNGILPRTLRHFLDKYPVETWRPGDCVITNDPWLATGHLPDITMVMPIFYQDRLVAFSGSIAHSPDIGGSLWSADCGELFEEGIRIQPVKWLRQGEPNQDVQDLLLGNVRVPDQVAGDLHAQISANRVCGARLLEFLADTELTNLETLATTLIGRAATAMQKAIAELPDGTYRAAIDADGFDEQKTHIECAVQVRGEQMHIDYTGTSPQIGRGLNCVMNYTDAYSAYPVKCALDPETPRNEGSYRPISVTAPEGSILNPTFPAPCNARQLTGHLLAGVIYQALAEAAPYKVLAECGGAPTMRAVFSGARSDGSRFSQILFASGGMGASAVGDGLPTTAFPTNAGAGSIEAFESVAPLMVVKKELRTDSGGAGRQRGGLGQECVVKNLSSESLQLSLLSDRHEHPASGMLGGQPGGASAIEMGIGRTPHPKSRTRIAPGEELTLRYAGGGGYGPPSERPRDAVLEDVRNGYVSPAAAESQYGVTNEEQADRK
ncbi:MAG: hydantoin utilization protein B [Gammaproteobacteria bacterium]|nr:hydantoin utilization protein B [Gammaproteobacteria bacterium]